jgi:hypothetical protein
MFVVYQSQLVQLAHYRQVLLTVKQIVLMFAVAVCR